MRSTNAQCEEKMIPSIGIVGGMGPVAGVDLVNKIHYCYAMQESKNAALCDQSHIPLILNSTPHTIPDRTAFLCGHGFQNPGERIAEIIHELYKQGSEIIGIACNTAHAAKIYNTITEMMPTGATLIHMIDEVVHYIANTYPSVKKVGILCTNGTYQSMVYNEYLQTKDLIAVYPETIVQYEYVHDAIYGEDGIKAHATPISYNAQIKIQTGIENLIERGAELIVLGCTELSLLPSEFIQQRAPKGIQYVNSSSIYAWAILCHYLSSLNKSNIPDHVSVKG